ncbi:hypothetical protein BDQ12DRAFT_718192 [Crucibulum laeve]|uniref:Uncharacterized protein n=1 Tax=Crucibulum laeve TaxID=68775 RepID=A0A5C3MIA9_9AGAR|nr:hypothetical protein BDQ12DRAFT_718192 [Crucibulum laeve]
MPRTRNISRAQWQAASASTASASVTTSMTTRRSSRSTQQRGENDENDQSHVSTRTTRATSSRTAALTSSSISATRSTRKVTTASAVGGSAKKGKGTVTLRKKQPLQDITAEILGQLESTHPGVAAPANIQTPASPLPMDDIPAPASTQARTQVQIPFASSLPPSSPPLFTSSPAILRSQPMVFDCLPCPPPPPVPHNTVRKKGSRNNNTVFTGIGEDDPELDAWDEFDARVEEEITRVTTKSDTPTPTSLDSDLFGFFALEKKLKVERDAQAAAEADVKVEKTEDQPVEAIESGGRVLVPSTSSCESPAIAPLAPFPIPTPMPAPPHKKKDHARLSLVAFCDEQCEESEELSSPSPTKPRVTKKRSSPSKDKEDGDDENDARERRVKRVRSNPSLPVPKLAENSSKKARTSLGSRNA